MEIYLYIVIALLVVVIIICSILLYKNGNHSFLRENRANMESEVAKCLEMEERETARLREFVQGDNDHTREFVKVVSGMSSDNMAKSLEGLGTAIGEKIADQEKRMENLTRTNEFRMQGMQTELASALDKMRIYIGSSMDKLGQETLSGLEKVRMESGASLERVRLDNEKQLEKMRFIVDDKLSQTLETRLGQSFELINNRLEAVYKGLGEMQGLARGVGDIKRVLTNVKVRGTFGELQLNNLLEQILTAEQYECNFRINPNSSERVDFAIRLPGRNERPLYLPIDSKFPMEEYQRLIAASESCQVELYEKSAKLLEARVIAEGKKIADKYVIPPFTTDFAILYLPMEGLYAEVLKRANVIENLQRIHIVLCGPTTLGALLNSLQLGFKTLAIEKRSTELWQLLSAFKTEFVRFTELLVRTQKKLAEASDTIEDATKKTRTIQRKLSSVSELTEGEADKLLEDTEIPPEI